MTVQPLRVVFLLEGTGLFGGVKVVLSQANLLQRRGHEVTVISREAMPCWLPVEARFRKDPELDPSAFPEADVVVATYWTTLGPALAAPSGQPVHYCQGLEYTYTHNQDQHTAILEAYRHPIPALCVAPHLVEELAQRFGRSGRVALQPLESFMKPLGRLRPHRRPRVLVVGPFEIDWKGAATALEAVRLLRGEGFDFRLVRISQWPQTAEERAIFEAEEFHHHLKPRAVAELMQQCDLLIAPSWEQEGFGLPVLEAMACGVPVVCSDIAPYQWFAAGAARLVGERKPAAFAAAARAVLEDADQWRRMRHAGLGRAAEFSAARGAQSIEDGLRWVVEGSWRSPS